MTFAKRLVVVLWAAASAAGFAGCHHGPDVTVERRDDGVMHLKCKTPLPQCLDRAEELCDHNRYAVLRAFDDHDYKGRDAFPGEALQTRDSEAFVRCGMRAVWGTDVTKLRASGVPPLEGEPTPAAAKPALACTPGASQACVGPGGCNGGQVCLPGGAAFGQCDCGGAKPPAEPPAQPAAP
jgi:hypothetical protein